MNDYSDLIFLMGAMIVFSLLSLQVSRTFQMNNRIQMEAEIEYNAVSIAQNEIDRVRWINSESDLNNHVSTYPKEVPLAVNGDTLFYDVGINTSDVSIPNSNVDNKQVTVEVTNEYLESNNGSGVQLQFIKSF